jgi:hypothetical protein
VFRVKNYINTYFYELNSFILINPLYKCAHHVKRPFPFSNGEKIWLTQELEAELQLLIIKGKTLTLDQIMERRKHLGLGKEKNLIVTRRKRKLALSRS